MLQPEPGDDPPSSVLYPGQTLLLCGAKTAGHRSKDWMKKNLAMGDGIRADENRRGRALHRESGQER